MTINLLSVSSLKLNNMLKKISFSFRAILGFIMLIQLYSCDNSSSSLEYSIEDLIGSWNVIGSISYIHDDGTSEEVTVTYTLTSDGSYTVANSSDIFQNIAILSFPISSGLWSFDNLNPRIKFYKTGPNGVELKLSTYYWDIIALEDTDNNLPYLNVDVFDENLNYLQELELEKID